ncbi:MAG: amidohydrolase/deacetylase family metallohydrolase [Firmicutes bacterium]|nr:amidohydrolase/deacetylase family metallohydrolase [Bacillota bacterium]
MAVDLLLRSGRIIDPGQGLDFVGDLLIEDGRIRTIGQHLTVNEGLTALDVSGLIITPGLIDLHTHVYPGVTNLGVMPDTVGVGMGVTTVVDAGSAGSRNFEPFLETTIRESQTRVLVFLNAAGDGLIREKGELADLRNVTFAESLEKVKDYPGVIRGIKARASASVVGDLGVKPIALAKDLAFQAGIPLVVHIGNAPPRLEEVLELLQRGDIVTHSFHGKPGGILGAGGEPLPEVLAARERGVLFDLGHGTSSFCFHTARKAFQAGFLPDTVGTDIYSQNLAGPVFSLAVTMSKLLALGLELPTVIAMATAGAASALGLAGTVGTLRPGVEADVTVLQLCQGGFSFSDSEGERLDGRYLLNPVMVLRKGEVTRLSGDCERARW